MLKKYFNKKNLYYLYTSPWVIAIIVTVLYVIMSPNLFNKYKIEYRLKLCKEDALEIYADMDCDGKDDVLKILKVKNSNEYKIETCGKNKLFKRIPNFTKYPFIADCDGNKAKELYFISNSKDSICLSVWDFKCNKIRNVFLGKDNSSYDFGYLGFADANNDGSKEFYFWVCSRRFENIRFVCRYDIKNDVLKKTSGLDARIRTVYLSPSTDDPKIVLTTKSFPTKNERKANYSEKFAWGFILDKNLNQVADPLCMEKSNYCLVCMNIKHRGEDRICVVGDCSLRTAQEKDISLIQMYDYFGNKVNEVNVPFDLLINRNSFFAIDNDQDSKIFIGSYYGGLLKYNSELVYEGKFFPGGLDKPIYSFVGDIDNDGKNEIFFQSKGFKENVFVKEDFSDPVFFKMPEPYSSYRDSRIVRNIYENIRGTSAFKEFGSKKVIPENVVISFKGLTCFINYHRDKHVWVKYFYVLGVFLVVFLLIWWIRYFVTKSVEEKYVIENTIAQLKFQNVSNQMSPHFTLNAMNSIASYIYKEDRETAYDYLCKLAKLVRNSLVDANKLERTLKEELDFVVSYLEIQKFRFKDRFDYKINVDNPSAYNIKVMPFLLQTFVENSMKHGLNDLGSGGKIIVDIISWNNGVKIIVEDNGIGRKAAAKSKFKSTGKGIKLVNDYISIINKKDKRNMSISIIDLEENSKPKGTRVEIFVDKI